MNKNRRTLEEYRDRAERLCLARGIDPGQETYHPPQEPDRHGFISGAYVFPSPEWNRVAEELRSLDEALKFLGRGSEGFEALNDIK